jgi:hypothetical protein
MSRHRRSAYSIALAVEALPRFEKDGASKHFGAILERTVRKMGMGRKMVESEPEKGNNQLLLANEE